MVDKHDQVCLSGYG
jgi:nucleotide-binding universal stress UspA family protein